MPNLQKTRQVADRLGVSDDSVRRLVASGDLRAIRLTPNGQFLFEPEQVEQLLERATLETRAALDAEREAAVA